MKSAKTKQALVAQVIFRRPRATWPHAGYIQPPPMPDVFIDFRFRGCETKIYEQLNKRIKPQFVSLGNELPMANRAGGMVGSERGFGESQPQQRSPFHEGSV